MAIKRIIGIDFGTSTSVVKCKRYMDGKPIGDEHHTESVTFGQGASEPRAMTIVRVNADGSVDCGIDEFLEGSTVYREFKMSLESENEEERERAKELTHEYIKYLYERYSYQNGFLGECDDEETIVSFPVKWKDETRSFMAHAVADAGFKNVSSIDEPSAALYAILAQEMSEIRNNGFLEMDRDNLILVIDMGAGTTDLAVSKCNVTTESGKVMATDIKNELLFSWPEDNVDITFGGREVDDILKDFLVDYIISCGLPKEAAENFIRNNTGVKGWKEETLSPTLCKNEPVKACTVAKQAQIFAPIKKEFPEITREHFEKLIAAKIEDYKTLVNGCLDNLEKNAEIDVVIFTGGHSAWYFAKELIDGTMNGIDHPALRKIQANKKRVFSLPHPQETVALGMVYSKLPFQIVNLREENKKVTIPNFVNISYEHFTNNRINNENFTVKTIYKYSQSVDKGFIISQSIKPGEMVDKGTEITFVISKGSEKKHSTAAEDNSKKTLSEKAIEYLEANIATANKLSNGNLNGLQMHLHIPNNEKIYLYSDTTFFSSGKNGFVITDKGFYFRALWEPSTTIRWATYNDDITISCNETNGMITFSLRGGRQYSKSFLSQASQAFDFFVGLQDALKANTADNIKKAPTDKTNKAPTDKTSTNTIKENKTSSKAQKPINDFDKVLTNTFGEFPIPPSILQLTKTMNNGSITQVQGKIYFAKDDSAFSNGRKGILINTQGIWCAMGNRNGVDWFFDDHRVRFTPWNIFVHEEITMDNMGIYCGQNCIFNVQSTNMLNIYKDLQEKLITNNIYQQSIK